MMKNAYKHTLQAPQSTGNQKLTEWGLHSTTDALSEAQRIAHYEWLSQTNTGRHILHILDIQCLTQTAAKVPMLPGLGDTFLIPPIPRSIVPAYNGKWRDNFASDNRDAIDTTSLQGETFAPMNTKGREFHSHKWSRLSHQFWFD